MKRALLTLLLVSCGGAAQPARAPRVEARADPPVEVLPVERFGDQTFVVLGRGEEPSEEGRRVDTEDGMLHFTVHTREAPVPQLTLVGTSGACEPTTATRAVMVRHYETPEDAEHYGGAVHDVLAITSPCDPVVALLGRVHDAHLVALEFGDPPFGAPIIGTGEGWTVRLEPGPSDDGICPGSPIHVDVKRGTQPLLRQNTYLQVSRVHLITSGERAWLVLEAFTNAEVIEMTGEQTQSEWTRPSGVDFAETCS